MYYIQSVVVVMNEKAIFAAGCFWGVEELFSRLPGVLSTRVGYTGGHQEKPTYHQVCTDTTGHAEAVEINFDSAKINYETLLEKFWSLHDPTTLNRQGPDVGSQYRSAVYYHTPRQQELAQTMKERLSVKFPHPIVTEITSASTFYEAEEYHQKYNEKNGRHCQIF
jgi:peptide-methionine (S)-S-oxide reductase